MHVRPLRPATHTGTPAADPEPQQPKTSKDSSSLPIIGRRSPASSSFVPARALPGAHGSGRSSWTPDHATARTRHLRGKSAEQAHPARRHEVTGSDQHTLLTNKTPMGAVLVSPPLAGGGREKDSRSVQSTASEVVASLNSPGPGGASETRTRDPLLAKIVNASL